ncbi:MAG: cobalt chelatase, partial [Clostridia bacterium]|nr:cobalt chelatase [Clostridia bacterium]
MKHALSLLVALALVMGMMGAALAEDADQIAADQAAAAIDAIYVQEWTEDTEAQILAARAAWEALTDEQKELVEGEDADPDYFGRDTGDA